MTLKTFQVWWESTLLVAVFRSGYKIYLPCGSGFGSLLYKNSLKGKKFKFFMKLNRNVWDLKHCPAPFNRKTLSGDFLTVFDEGNVDRGRAGHHL